MEYDAITALWDKHPGWRLLRATNAALVLTFLGHHFVEENQGATAAGPLAGALDDLLYTLNAATPDEPRFPRGTSDYLDAWAAPDSAWLRRFYPLGSDEVHYDATEQADPRPARTAHRPGSRPLRRSGERPLGRWDTAGARADRLGLGRRPLALRRGVGRGPDCDALHGRNPAICIVKARLSVSFVS